MLRSMPPNAISSRPVAVTTMSASSSPRGEGDAGRGERVDGVGDDLGRSVGDRLVEVGGGDDAEPLIPRLVGGFEVGVHRVTGWQVAFGDPPGAGARPSGSPSGNKEDTQRDQHVSVAGDVVRRGWAAPSATGRSSDPAGRTGTGIRWWALRHRHVPDGRHHRRDEG